MKILLSAAIVVLANIAAIPYAIDTSSNAQDTLIIEHKLSLIDEQIDEQIDDEQYEQSEKAANARHANQFIRNNRSDGL